MKTNKSYTKRLRLTKTGKIIARKPGKGHFNAKKTGVKSIAGKRPYQLIISNKDKARFLPGLIK